MSNSVVGFVPLFERLLVLPDPVEHEVSGITLPIESRKRPNSGVVVSIGHLVHESKCEVNPGDHVLYMKYSGFDLEIDGVLHHVIMANDLVGIIDKTINQSFNLKEYA